MSNLDMDMDDINSSNVKRSWRTLIEFPTDKVACAIFVQETVSCMIKQKLVKTYEEIDEAMVKLYEMLKSNDEINSSKRKCNSLPGDCFSDKDSIRSTCGTVAHFDDDIGDMYSFSISDQNDKCCQAPSHYINTVQIGHAQLESPVDFIFRRSMDLMSTNFNLERAPQGVHMRLANVSDDLIENDFNTVNGNLCNHFTPRRNYFLVVEENNSFEKEVSIQTKKRSRKSKKNRNWEKRCTINDGTNDGTNLIDNTFQQKGQDKSKASTPMVETFNDLSLNSTKRQSITLPYQYNQEGLSLKTYQSITLNRNPGTFQKQGVRLSFGVFSWMSSVYYLFVSVIQLTKNVYHRIV